MRNLNVAVLQVDELWSFVGKKQAHKLPGDPMEFGDCYTFTAIDAFGKAIVSYETGRRDAASAAAIVADLRARVVNRPQVTSDGFPAYAVAVERAFGGDVDFGIAIKEYEKDENGNDAAHRYSPSRVTGVQRIPVQGEPEVDLISTSIVERSNLSIRMSNRRHTRLTNAYSKKLRNHKAAMALFVAAYNLCRVHSSIRQTPAMALGVTDHVWSIEELILAATAPVDDERPVPPLETPSIVDEDGPSLGAINRAQRERNLESRRKAKEAQKAPPRKQAIPIGEGTRVPWLRIIEGGRAA
jgi:IS1 family transposase